MRKNEQIVTTLKTKLSTDFNYAKQFLFTLYKWQTRQERKEMRDIVRNNVGFCRNDASILTYWTILIKRNVIVDPGTEVMICSRVSRYIRQALMAIDEGLIPNPVM